MPLGNKVVLVTGGARGMGREYVRGFRRAGARVIATDVSWEPTGVSSHDASFHASIMHDPDVLTECMRSRLENGTLGRSGWRAAHFSRQQGRLKLLAPGSAMSPDLARHAALNAVDTSKAGPPRGSEGEMSTDRTLKRSVRQILTGVLLAAVGCGVLTACSAVPHPPTYTDAELQAKCERNGGWWRGALIPGYCEYESPFP